MLWLIIGRTISISINHDHDFKIFHSKFLKKIFSKPDNVNSLRTIMLELRTAIRVKMFTNHQEKLKKYSIYTIQNICRYHWSSTKICSLLILQANSELLLLTTKSINQLTEHHDQLFDIHPFAQLKGIQWDQKSHPVYVPICDAAVCMQQMYCSFDPYQFTHTQNSVLEIWHDFYSQYSFGRPHTIAYIACITLWKVQ